MMPGQLRISFSRHAWGVWDKVRRRKEGKQGEGRRKKEGRKKKQTTTTTTTTTIDFLPHRLMRTNLAQSDATSCTRFCKTRAFTVRVCESERDCMCVRERECVCVREKERERERERVCVCV